MEIFLYVMLGFWAFSFITNLLLVAADAKPIETSNAGRIFNALVAAGFLAWALMLL